jgi:hypothetical protein
MMPGARSGRVAVAVAVAPSERDPPHAVGGVEVGPAQRLGQRRGQHAAHTLEHDTPRHVSQPVGWVSGGGPGRAWLGSPWPCAALG